MQEYETALGTKLAEKGILPRNIRLQLAIMRYQKDGGSWGVAFAMLNAAYGRGNDGHARIAENGQGSDAGASSSAVDDAAGHHANAEKATAALPAAPSPGQNASAEMASPPMPGTGRSAGQLASAEKARQILPGAAARILPGHAKRGFAAIAETNSAIKKSLFDSTILPDGRRLREVKWSECPRLANRYRFLSRLLTAIHNVGVPADPNDTIDNLLNEDRLREIVATVERFNDIH